MADRDRQTKNVPSDKTMAHQEGSQPRRGHIGPGSGGNPDYQGPRAADVRSDGMTVAQPATRESGGGAMGTGDVANARTVDDRSTNTGVGSTRMSTAQATPEKAQKLEQGQKK